MHHVQICHLLGYISETVAFFKDRENNIQLFLQGNELPLDRIVHLEVARTYKQQPVDSKHRHV